MKKQKVLVFFIMLNLLYSIILCQEYETKKQYKNDKINEIVILVNEAADMVEKEGEKFFKNFKEYKTKWFNQNNYILVFDIAGKCIVNEDIIKRDKIIIDGKVINENGFQKWFLFETKNYKLKEGFLYYLGQKQNSISLIWKMLFTRIVKAPSGKEYIIASGQEDVRLEERIILDEFDKIIELIRDKDRLSFPIIRKKVNNFFGDENFLLIFDIRGNILFNTSKNKKFFDKKNIFEEKDSLGTFFIKAIINDALSKNFGKIVYYCPKKGDVNLYAREMYYRTAILEGEKVIVAYTILFDNAISFNIDTMKEDIYEVKYLTKTLAQDLSKMSLGDLKNKIISDGGENNYIRAKEKNPFFIIDYNTKKIVFDSQNYDLQEKNIKNIYGKSVWKTINMILKYNDNRGWINFSCNDEQDEFSIFKKYQYYFVYIMAVDSIDKNKYIVCFISNTKRLQEEFLKMNLEVLKNYLLRNLEHNKSIDDIKNNFNNLVINGSRLFITDNEGNQIFDSDFPYIENTNILKMVDSDGHYIVRNYINLMKKSKNNEMLIYNSKNNNGLITKKIMFLDKILTKSKNYIIGIEVDYFDINSDLI
ncbi:MAG: cache domain-containing protein [Elusimicrobiota bacterium]|nr:cache domain-containing protein [Elusimicrobiota bacterium]